jgi:hypothetical protein
MRVELAQNAKESGREASRTTVEEQVLREFSGVNMVDRCLCLMRLSGRHATVVTAVAEGHRAIMRVDRSAS